MRYHEKHRMTFVEGRYATKNVINTCKRNDERHFIILNVLGKKNDQTSVSDADSKPLGQRINSVNLVSGIIRLPSGWDFSVSIGDRC